MSHFNLPGRLNFQTNPADLEYKNALSKILYPQHIPTPYFHPKSPYALAGLGAHGAIPGPPYCTDFPDYASMLTYFGVELCTQATPGDQYACSLRNAPKLINVANFQNDCSYPSAYQSGYTPVNPANPAGGGTGYNVPPGTIVLPAQTPQTSGGGSLIFAPSRSGNVLQVGDTYTLTVLGPQNSSVTSTITFNGSTNTTAQGTTGADGSWSTYGGIDSSEIGTWHQVWYVGGHLAGSIDFTVLPAGSAPSSGGTTPPVTPPSGGTVPLPNQAPPATRPVVTFTPSRQGVLYPGDTWTIRITGGAPTTMVTAQSTQNGIPVAAAQMGPTDQYGNFLLTGTIDSSSIGNWQETWSVGGQNAGSFGFTVAAPSSPVTPPGSGPTGGGTQTPPPGGSNTTPPAGSGGTGTTAPSTTLIPGVSNTALLGGAGLLVLLVMMGKK